MTHEKFIDLWERACKSPHRIQSMYFGGSHGFCSEWKIELWSNGNLGAVLRIGNCGIWDSPEARKTWRLLPSITGQTSDAFATSMNGGALTNEQTLRCVAAFDEGMKLAPTSAIEDLL